MKEGFKGPRGTIGCLLFQAIKDIFFDSFISNVAENDGLENFWHLNVPVSFLKKYQHQSILFQSRAKKSSRLESLKLFLVGQFWSRRLHLLWGVQNWSKECLKIGRNCQQIIRLFELILATLWFFREQWILGLPRYQEVVGSIKDAVNSFLIASHILQIQSKNSLDTKN